LDRFRKRLFDRRPGGRLEKLLGKANGARQEKRYMPQTIETMGGPLEGR
jgi:hypothetical protein